MKNNAYKPVNFEIFHGKNAICTSNTISPGKRFTFEVEKNMAGRWYISADTSDGSNMNLTVNATQYSQVNN